MSTEIAVQDAARIIHGMDRVADTLVGEFLPRMSRLSFEQLTEIVTSAGRLEHATYIVRGAAGYTLHERLSAQSSEKGAVTLAMQQVARTWGVEWKTLCQDIQIYRDCLMSSEAVHYQEPLPGEEGTEQILLSIASMELVPPRWVLETALKAPDKQAVINAAMTRIGEGSYTRDQMRKDVQALRLALSREKESKGGGSGKGSGPKDKKKKGDVPLTITDGGGQETTTQAIEDGGKWLQVRVTDEVLERLFRAANVQKCTPQEILSQLARGEMLSIDEDHMCSLIYQMNYYRKVGKFSGTLTEYVHFLIDKYEKVSIKDGMSAPRKVLG